jgi:hypothetical protein
VGAFSFAVLPGSHRNFDPRPKVGSKRLWQLEHSGLRLLWPAARCGEIAILVGET